MIRVPTCGAQAANLLTACIRPATSILPNCTWISFCDGIDTVDSGNREFLFGSAGPVNLDLFHLRRLSQAEVYPLLRARSVAAAAEYVRALAYPARRHIDFGSDRIPRTLGSSNQL